MAKNLYLWKKKIGDVHISGKNATYCGRPMLGNNYADQTTDEVNCEECKSILEKNEKVEE